MIIRKRYTKRWYMLCYRTERIFKDYNAINNVLRCYDKYGFVNNVMRYINYETIRMSFDNNPVEEANNNYYEDNEIRYIPEIKVATGIDNIDSDTYKEKLNDNIENLVGRLKEGKYRPKPVERVYIDKPQGGKRPLGKPTFEDKLVQEAIVNHILNPIYERIFLDCSYAYREGRNCKGAIDKIKSILSSNPDITYIVDADIKGYFNNVSHKKLMEMISYTIRDRKLLAIIRDTLKSGYVYRKKFYKTNKGTPQGGVISPILANIYLHYVLDNWFYKEMINDIKGKAYLVRYADDFVILCSDSYDSEKIIQSITKRFNKYNLELAKDKTKIVNMNIDSLSFLGFDIRKDKDTDKVTINISKERMPKRKRKILELMESSVNDINIYKPNDNELELYYQDYIAWINNTLCGTYKYFSQCDNIELLDELYEYAKAVVVEYYSKVMDNERVKYYVSHIMSRIDYEILIMKR